MITVNGVTFKITGTCQISSLKAGTPFMYNERVCLPHGRYTLTRCNDFFNGTEYDIKDFNVSVPTLEIVHSMTGAGDAALEEKITSLEERLSDLEKLVKMMIRNS